MSATGFSFDPLRIDSLGMFKALPIWPASYSSFLRESIKIAELNFDFPQKLTD
jgi:hypothetical protein